MTTDIIFLNESKTEMIDLVNKSANRFFSYVEGSGYKNNTPTFNYDNGQDMKPLSRFRIFVNGSQDFPLHPTPEDESYELSISDWEIFISAPTATGAINGITTLLQLLDCQLNYQSGVSECMIPNGSVYIKDAPKYNYRAIMLDAARNFIPMTRMY
mmetsp:Transcript_37505/g.57451  ORF Transcript_37505/g.57451 Transcript_37505/m.57451 type:complete len:156 (+) Transcript_37505:272-739(+)